MAPRDLPRTLAPVLFAAVDVINGVSLILARNEPRSPGLAKIPGSLTGWGVAFVLAGALIPLGIGRRRVAWVTAAVALGLWGMWASLVIQAVSSPLVTLHAPASSVGFTVLHFLLFPYRREARHVGSP